MTSFQIEFLWNQDQIYNETGSMKNLNENL